MSDIKNILEGLLKKDSRLVSDEDLLLNKVMELAINDDPTLIKNLLSDTTTKEYFFTSIDNIYVFDKSKFVKFISNKSFLPDSFTFFKNKIGLTSDNEFLSENKEVVLSWPYKDCVLEGGQTNDSESRKEIFWNEILAPSNIDRLFEAKAFIKARKYSSDSVERVSKILPTDNLIIKGNNLIALHSLAHRYKEKVKLIYIDPPYNTGTDSFGYNDSFRHSSWLTFMKNRLEIARKLLRPDGVIFVHIGDEELHYLKVLMDEIFGRDFFVGTIPRKTRSGKSDVPFRFSQDFDWLLVYTKKATPQTILFKRSVSRKYYRSSDFPDEEWRLNPITTQRTVIERPNSDFTMVNPKTGEEFPVNPNRSWAVTKDTFQQYYDSHKIIFPGDYDFLNNSKPMMRVFKRDEKTKFGEDFDKTSFSSDTINIDIEKLLKKSKNATGTAEMIELFGVKAFAYPKNETLMKTIIESCTAEGDIVLDYHLGSGTTAAVAHKLGRQYIGIEQMDYIETITVERLKKVIQGDGVGISDECNWEGGGDFVYMELALSNESLMNQINEANTQEDLLKCYDLIINDDVILSSIPNRSDLINSREYFSKLNDSEKKKLLILLLDKNFYYLPYSEIRDADHGIDEITIQLNDNFYQGGV